MCGVCPTDWESPEDALQLRLAFGRVGGQPWQVCAAVCSLLSGKGEERQTPSHFHPAVIECWSLRRTKSSLHSFLSLVQGVEISMVLLSVSASNYKQVCLLKTPFT